MVVGFGRLIFGMAIVVGGFGAANAGECAGGSISQTAIGEVKGPADYVSFMIESMGKGRTEGDALQESDRNLGKALVVLWEEGGAQRDDLSVGEFAQGTAHLAQDGWEGRFVRRRVEVSVRKLDALRDVVKKVARLVDVDMGKFEFGVDEPDVLRDGARADAFKIAERRALAWAKAARLKLESVHEIRERSLTLGGGAMLSKEAFAGDLPIKAGMVPVMVTVEVTWCTKPAEAD